MQATQFKVSDKLKLVSTVTEDGTTSTEYKCKVKVQLAGDSLWDCRLKTVTITGIYIDETVYDEDDSSVHISVMHTGGDGSWRLYTDTGFEEAVSDLLGCDVVFTEQGMQEDGCASMEL